MNLAALNFVYVEKNPFQNWYNQKQNSLNSTIVPHPHYFICHGFVLKMNDIAALPKICFSSLFGDNPVKGI